MGFQFDPYLRPSNLLKGLTCLQSKGATFCIESVNVSRKTTTRMGNLDPAAAAAVDG